MKKISFLIFSLIYTTIAFSQYCGGSGTSVCTPPSSLPGVGFYPSYDSLPCAIIGQPYDQTIYFQAPTTVTQGGSTYNLNWIRVDTIANLPCGLCWRMGTSNNQIPGGGRGCVRITGTTYDAPGQFKLRVIVAANVQAGFFPVTVANQNAETLGVKYWGRVAAPGGNCVPVDTLAIGNTASIPGTAAVPTVTGNNSICSSGSTTLSVTGTYDAYVWSTGALTSSISVNAGGTYTVTVYDNCASATGSRTVTVSNPSPTLSAAGPTTFCQGSSVSLNAGAGFNSYSWSNGATTQQITVSQSGAYTCTVTQSGCQGVSNTINVTVNSANVSITHNGPTSFCQGGSVTLDAGTGYSAYSWSNGATSQSINVTAANTYSVTVTQNGCTATDSEVVTVTTNNLSPTITPSGSTNICPGGSVSLDAGVGYDSYTWSNSGSTQSVSVSSQGTYTVTVTQGSCTGSASASVAVGNFPVTVNITPSGPTSFCPGGSVDLDAGSGFDSYSWSTGDLTQTTTANANGAVTVTVTDAACTGTASVSIQVSNIPVSVNISASGPLAFCAGGSVTLDAGAGFNGYNWSNTDQTQTITVNTSGSYIVTVQQNGCVGRDTADVVVNPLPLPSITPAGNQSFCSGGNINLSTGSYSSYTWSNGSTTQSVVVSNSGSYNVTVTDANQCTGSAVNPTVVTVNQNPVASTTVIAGGIQNENYIVASPSNATTYQWQFAVNQDTTTGQTVNFNQFGDSLITNCITDGGYWRVAVTDANGCSDTSSYTYIDMCVGLSDVNSSIPISVVPNPARDVVFVSYTLPQTLKVEISLIDVSGRTVLQVVNEMQTAGKQFKQLDVADLAQGIYFISLKTGNLQSVRKLVVE